MKTDGLAPEEHMPTDFDNLIRNAKPPVPSAARERVLGYVLSEGAGGAAAPNRASFRVLARVAALVMLAVGAGVVSALVSAPERADVIVDFNAQVNDLRTRVEARESQAAKIATLEQQVSALELERDSTLRELVVGVINARDQQRMLEWRERHVEYVRAHNRRAADATIEQLRADLKLTNTQEAEVRALLDDAGKEVEGLIGNFYGRHGHRSMHREFERVARETDERLNALLSEQQRVQVGEGLVSSRPEDWGPSSEFRDGTDYEVYMNWMTVSRE